MLTRIILKFINEKLTRTSKRWCQKVFFYFESPNTMIFSRNCIFLYENFILSMFYYLFWNQRKFFDMLYTILLASKWAIHRQNRSCTKFWLFGQTPYSTNKIYQRWLQSMSKLISFLFFTIKRNVRIASTKVFILPQFHFLYNVSYDFLFRHQGYGAITLTCRD